MNNHVFYVQWILDRKYGKNVRVLDSNYCSGEIVKTAPRRQGLPWLTPLLSTFILCAGVAFISPQVQAAYTVVELEADLSEESGGSVRGLNNKGEVVGGDRMSGRRQGFLVSGDGGRQDIAGRPDSDYSVARGINDAGQVVGTTNTPTGMLGYRSLRNGGKLYLNPLTGDNSSSALAVNNAGEAVGYSSGPPGVRAVRWSRVGLPQELPGLTGSLSSRALAIDGQGNAAGVSETDSGPHAVVWKGDEIKELKPLPGHYVSEAHGINDNGAIVGFSGDSEIQPRRAVLWESYGDGPTLDLGALQDGRSSWAHGVNNDGKVVGTSQTNAGNHAFLWTREDGMRDLNDVVTLPGVILTDAVAISSPRGLILAIGRWGDLPDTAEHEVKTSVYLLTP